MKFGRFLSRERLDSPRSHLIAFFLFLAFVALMGGASREDVQSLAILRPIAALFLAWGLLFAPGWRGMRSAPLIGALLLALLMIVQLVPLPSAMWSGLAGREIFAEIGAQMGLADLARPLTLSPFETTNALFAMLVPIAAAVLLSNVSADDYDKVLVSIAALGLASAAMGLAQLAGSPEGPLYTYRITNFGEPVGLFANRNHQAVLLAITIVLLGWYAGGGQGRRTAPGLRMVLLTFGVPILFILNLVGGSRLGFALAVLALFPMALFAFRNDRVSHLVGKQSRINISPRVWTIVTIGAAIMIVGLAMFVSRSAALDRFMVTDTTEEMRALLLPIFSDMIAHYFPWGSGFGTFEHVYPIFEPTELIERRYLNQAHNDLAQFLIEGGLAAIVLLAGAVFWFVRRLNFIRKKRSLPELLTGVGLPAAIGIAMLAGASLFDYPLRTPIVMTVLVVFAFLLDRSGRRREFA